MSFVEGEIDRLNESFLQLSVQLQSKAQMSSRLERESSACNHAVVISWNSAYYIYNYIIQRMNLCAI